MKYHPDKRDEILAERIKAELQRKHLYPRQRSVKSAKKDSPATLDNRIEKFRKLRDEEWRATVASIDAFWDSEENQKKYGFRTEILNGVRSIYYDGDFDVLEEAAYGPVVIDYSNTTDTERSIRLSMTDGNLFARLPHTIEYRPVKIRIRTDEAVEPNFTIVSESGTVLTRLSLVDPAYYPNEEGCLYSIDMKGLTVLNGYIRENFDNLIQEWNRQHPEKQLDEGIPLPNYRFLASAAYLQSKLSKSL